MNYGVTACLIVLGTVSACGGGETETVTKTVKVTEVPQTCLDALDDAETVIGLAVDAMDIMADGFDAASRFDADGLGRIAGELNSLTPRVTDAKQTYNTSAAACRGAAD